MTAPQVTLAHEQRAIIRLFCGIAAVRSKNLPGAEHLPIRARTSCPPRNAIGHDNTAEDGFRMSAWYVPIAWAAEINPGGEEFSSLVL